MPITRRTDYAVRLMYELAQLPAEATLSTRDLCELADVPECFGTSIVQFLVDAGMVIAGGYRNHLLSLAEPATEITMAEIIRTCEPDFFLSPCTSEPESCGRSSHCGAHRMWGELDAMVWLHLESITLAQVATDKFSAVGAVNHIPSSFAGLTGTA
ncbi:MAG: Rrf2 family transcriptional regulator [Actinobacteria bacterium]|nr:Rrf2 family transcriptional regulator [Actinomycetota bacterium]